MRQFSGCEPLVGEIVGLRTFRVDESGRLLPLYSNQPWYDRTNTARCTPPTGEAGRGDHRVAAPQCECGFYAYGTEAAAAGNRGMRYVQAVVSCWGSVVAGTQGVRAEHARIDALWLHPAVPKWVRARVAQTYPSARIFVDRAAMLAEHPLSRLPCYQPPPQRGRLPRIGAATAGAVVLGLGLLPSAWLTGPIWFVWLAAVSVTAALALWLLVGTDSTGHVAAAVVAAGVLAWLAAPIFGPVGWALRLPVLRGILVTSGSYLFALRPGYFPVVKSARERAFAGMRR